MNWMITNGATREHLSVAVSNFGVLPYLGTNELLTKWFDIEPTIFVALEARRFDLVKWLVDELKVPVDPHRIRCKTYNVFTFALAVGTVEICDCASSKMVSQRNFC